MAQTNNTSEFDQKTRANLAYGWSVAIIVFIGYALFQYGSILAVLTLLLGFITGTAATILAVYFGAPIAAKKNEPTVTTNADTTNVSVNQNPKQDDAN